MSPINHFFTLKKYFLGDRVSLLQLQNPHEHQRAHISSETCIYLDPRCCTCCASGVAASLCAKPPLLPGEPGVRTVRSHRGRPAAAEPIAPCSCGQGIRDTEKPPHSPQGEGSRKKDRLGRNPGPPRGWRNPEHRSSTTGIHLGEAEPSGKDIPDSRDGARPVTWGEPGPQAGLEGFVKITRREQLATVSPSQK